MERSLIFRFGNDEWRLFINTDNATWNAVTKILVDWAVSITAPKIPGNPFTYSIKEEDKDRVLGIVWEITHMGEEAGE